MTDEKDIDKQNRTHQVTIRLEPKIHDALLEVANRVGIKPASIAGLAIGDYVTKAQAAYGATNQMQKIMAHEMSTLMFQYIAPMLSEEQLQSFSDDGDILGDRLAKAVSILNNKEAKNND